MEVKAALYLAAGGLFLLFGVLLSGRVGIAGLGLVVLPMITLGLCLITIGGHALEEADTKKRGIVTKS